MSQEVSELDEEGMAVSDVFRRGPLFVQGQRSQHVRRSPGEKLRECHIDQSVKHLKKKMFCWGCFSYAGVESIRPFHGMIDSAQYIQVLEENAISDMRKTFPDGSRVFQQDLAPCHTS